MFGLIKPNFLAWLTQKTFICEEIDLKVFPSQPAVIKHCNLLAVKTSRDDLPEKLSETGFTESVSTRDYLSRISQHLQANDAFELVVNVLNEGCHITSENCCLFSSFECHIRLLNGRSHLLVMILVNASDEAHIRSACCDSLEGILTSHG